MTRDKDFKRLARDRSRRTGESYALARRRLVERSGRPSREQRNHPTMDLTKIIPVLRSFDESSARAFYLDYLGMTVDWEHRFEPKLPLYMQVSRGALVLHLSEHHGDATPGSLVYVAMTGIAELHHELGERHYPNLNPALRTDELGTWLELVDPFGNHLRFHERL
jgi:catechol 2,3-dioxygenase-like lactoylglutathione lyase family enzyme